MSLYNMLFGVNPFAQLWLSMLNLGTEDVGRFRDCYLTGVEKDADTGEVNLGDAQICVYTRNGGGNREQYQEVIDTLATHPCYVFDEDDDFDCTYCTIYFKIPDKFTAVVCELISTDWSSIAQASISPSMRWQIMLEKLQKGDESDPSVSKAMDVGRSIFEKLNEVKKDGGGIVEV
jgi:hypothetical protein